MKEFVLLVALFCLVILAGCRTVAVLPVEGQSERQVLKNYTVGSPMSVTTGSPMIDVKSGAKVSFLTYSVREPVTPPMVTGFDPKRMAELNPSQVWVPEKLAAEGGYVLTSTDYEPGDKFAIHILPDGRIGKGWLYRGTYAKAQQGKWPGGPLFVEKQGAESTFHNGAFGAELIYSGRSGSTIKLLYREYVDDLARPAYSQQLEYDLDQSETIRFKSLTIDVTEATNSDISYNVVSDEDLPWLP